MMQHRISIYALIFISLTAFVKPTHANSPEFKPTRPGEVYLLRGLANIFSLGMDEMGKQFRDYGIESEVYNHSHWQALADELIERSYEKEISYPIIIIGHSLGAGAAPQMATMLGRRGIPVKYVVMYDPVEPTQVGKNIEEVVNYYLPKKNNTNVVSPADDFEGKFENINVRPLGGINHLNIDYNKEIRSTVYEEALKYSEEQAELNEKE